MQTQQQSEQVTTDFIWDISLNGAIGHFEEADSLNPTLTQLAHDKYTFSLNYQHDKKVKAHVLGVLHKWQGTQTCVQCNQITIDEGSTRRSQRFAMIWFAIPVLILLSFLVIPDLLSSEIALILSLGGLMMFYIPPLLNGDKRIARDIKAEEQRKMSHQEAVWQGIRNWFASKAKISPVTDDT